LRTRAGYEEGREAAYAAFGGEAAKNARKYFSWRCGAGMKNFLKFFIKGQYKEVFSMFMRRAVRRFAAAAGAAALLTVGAAGYYQSQIPDSFYVTQGHELTLPNIRGLQSAALLDYSKTSLAGESTGASEMVELRLFGLVPVKTTHVSVISEQQVVPGGTVFGIKLFTKGVMVVDLNSIDTASGPLCPAKLAGLQKGDILLSLDGREVNSNEEVADIIAASNGRKLTVSYRREGAQESAVLQPVQSATDGKYKGGLWVRDSSAGIGTLTYYDEDTGGFAGLGHGICDVDTGQLLPLSSGEVCAVRINSIVKGRSGTPGELRGSFASNRPSGQLLSNSEAGVFGILERNPNTFTRVPVALKQNVHTGAASILCTLDDGGVREYEIRIDKIDLNPQTLTKNMMISVTDPLLIQKTGGIVQGMSGSPILQDGRLVGAVTHVFVNNPAKGYGIFAENMLEYSKELKLCG